MDEVRDDRWVQFVDFAGDKHGCNPEELEVDNWSFDAAEVPIDEAHGGLHRFWQQFELDLDDH